MRIRIAGAVGKDALPITHFGPRVHLEFKVATRKGLDMRIPGWMPAGSAGIHPDRSKVILDRGVHRLSATGRVQLPWGLVDQEVVKERILKPGGSIPSKMVTTPPKGGYLDLKDEYLEMALEKAKESYLDAAKVFNRGLGNGRSHPGLPLYEEFDSINPALIEAILLKAESYRPLLSAISVEEFGICEIRDKFFLWEGSGFWQRLLYTLFGPRRFTFRTNFENSVFYLAETVLHTKEKVVGGPLDGTIYDAQHVGWVIFAFLNNGADESKQGIAYQLYNMDEALLMCPRRFCKVDTPYILDIDGKP
mmetsp:Transcript_17139/g.27714  ORF Transcript_17139/g.27714 Transcript_17139/m.27714 type:complete len:306 (+) Transcript_17139:172-1089(+)|eukprot:CAMPEP_0203805536 /NCGR_PEP_ID=MMETSP0100_2-20121128/14296_1 /ASSEMBLY_ACC=CAM_ASM_000210 /TAXON_ID=96639 /ORGANISM=" , Strain NY0313808BC1" /LENGTH=305 /DNA_ID=CAMNT_0050714079 /DNA_START=94 /DNA_END=1011 /DNA_ORIENTATION=+